MSTYALTWSLAAAWNNRYMLELTITNTSSTTLESAGFDLFVDGAVDHLWRAEWSALDQGQVRVDVSTPLAPGESRAIGLTVDGDPSVAPVLVAVLANDAPVEAPADASDTASDLAPVAPDADPVLEQSAAPEPAAIEAEPLSLAHAQRKSWSDGFVHDVTVTNDGNEPLDVVQVELAFDGLIERLWNGTFEQLEDGRWLVTVELDRPLAAGESASFGFTAEADPSVAVSAAPVTGADAPDAGAETTQEPAPLTSITTSDPEPAPQVEPTPSEPTVSPDPAPAPQPDAKVVDVPLGTSAAELQGLINGAESGTVLQLQAGTYHFDRTVTLDRDGVSVLGAGSDATVITVDSGLGQEAFRVGDGGRAGAMTLSQDVAEGATTLTLSGGHSFAVGDYVYLSRENTDAFFDEIGDTTWLKDAPLRASIVEVTAVDGGRLELASGVHFDFVTGETSVQEIDLVEDVHLGGFTIDYGLGAADPSNFANALSAYNRDAVIQVEGTIGLEIEDVVAHDIPSLGINVALSRDMLVEGSEMTGAHNKGSGGNGYALQLRDVYDSAFVGLTDMDMRHSVVFASWRSAVNNDVHVHATDRDINFHGGRDHGNSVWVDHSIRDAESDIIAPTYFVNVEGTHYGAPTDAGANTAVFGHVVGTRLRDEVQGRDGGSWLDGAGSHDTLSGGNGADVLIGGEGNDVMVGADGADIALYRGQSRDFRFDTMADGATEVDDRNGGDGDEGTDLLYEVDWIVFRDAALNVSDGSWHALDAVDGVFAGVASTAPGDFAGPDTRAALDAWLDGGNMLLAVEETWTAELLYHASAINNISELF